MPLHSEYHLRQVMRSAAWMWIVYLTSMAVVDLSIYLGSPASPVLSYYLVNGIPALLFLGMAYSQWLERYASFVTPLMIVLISAVPIMTNHLLALPLPRAPLSNVEGMVLRQLPVMFIGLVLAAWHYSLVVMFLFSLGTNAFELLVLFIMGQLNDPRLESFYFITIIRTICFVVVGVFINQLITHLRAQQESLKRANRQLTHYASTLERLTVSRERNRMSRELHDTVVHTLSGLSVQLETAKVYWDVDPATAKELLGQSLEATRSGLVETRRALKELRASPLDDLGLVKAIQNIAETAAQRGRLIVNLSLPDHDPLLSPDVEQCLYRVTQEAVENVIHHAQARCLCVSLNSKDQNIELRIQDDGIGFNSGGEVLPGHFGISGMKERAKMAGGELTITSRPNIGTSVWLVIKG